MGEVWPLGDDEKMKAFGKSTWVSYINSNVLNVWDGKDVYKSIMMNQMKTNKRRVLVMNEYTENRELSTLVAQ